MVKITNKTKELKYFQDIKSGEFFISDGQLCMKIDEVNRGNNTLYNTVSISESYVKKMYSIASVQPVDVEIIITNSEG